MLGLNGFHFTTTAPPSTWVSTGLTVDVETNFTTFDFLDNNANDNALTPNTSDRIVYNGVQYPVSQIYVIGLTIHTDTGGTFNVPAVSGANATGFRVYDLGGGNYILRPIDNTLTMPGLPPLVDWDTFTFTSFGTTPGTSMPAQNDPFAICFVAGTRILTATGEKPVEALAAGDLVVTRDRGPQPLLWVGCTTFTAASLATRPNQAPIRITSGALAKNLPARPLMVSPQHRVLVSGPAVQRICGKKEVLIPAKALLERSGVSQMGTENDVHYYHLLFERHELVQAEGALCESFFPGPMAMEMLSPENRCVVQRLLQSTPDGTLPPYPPVRPFEIMRRARSLVRDAHDGPLAARMPQTLSRAGSGPLPCLR